jgi:hypothetical protein
MAKDKRGKVGRIPIHGSADYNMGWYMAIGGLVVNWANNESVFLAMLQVLLLGGKQSAAIVWHSHQNTRARLELVSKLCREQVTNQELLTKIDKAIRNFVGFTRTRNFYCHAMYRYDKELRLFDATHASMPQEGEPITFQTKRFDLSSLNEITDASIKLGEFNRELWDLVAQLQAALGVQRVVPPPLPHVPTENQGAQVRPDTDGTPEGQQ